jgi:Family of unknown function (DUF5662)
VEPGKVWWLTSIHNRAARFQIQSLVAVVEEMKKHLRYRWYVLRHKWYVFRECAKRGIWLQGLIHDWSKFLPEEWGPYAEFFYGSKIIDSKAAAAFNVAWLHHQHRSPHHWQHWVLREDDGSTIALEMPRRFAVEMLCDWIGAGKAILGAKANTPAWYMKNKEQIVLHPKTRELVEHSLITLVFKWR